MHNRKKSPDFLITHQFDRDKYHPETNKILTIDHHNTILIEDESVIVSHIYKTNHMNAAYKNGKKQLIDPKPSRDKITIGDSEDGLPFKIVARNFCGNSNAMFNFIDDYIVTLMREYAKLLTESDNLIKTIQKLIDEIDLSHKNHATNLQFNISIGITFEYNNKLLYAGFVHGETGFAYRVAENTLRADNNVPPLTPDDYKFHQLAYSSPANEAHKRIFVKEVERNNKIYGYTYLINGLRYYPSNESNEYEITDLMRVSLDDNPLKEKTLSVFTSSCISAEINKETCEIGDTFTTSYLIIPTRKIQALKRNRIQLRLDLGKHKKEFLHNIHQYNKDSDLFIAGKKVFDSIEKIEKNDECNAGELILDLIACNNVLTNNNQNNIDALNKRANLAEGRASNEEKDLGTTLKIFGSVIAAIGACMLPTPVGIGLVIAGGLLTMSGFSIFYHGRQQGRSKELTDFAAECKDTIRQNI